MTTKYSLSVFLMIFFQKLSLVNSSYLKTYINYQLLMNWNHRKTTLDYISYDGLYMYIANRICSGTKSTIVMYVLVKKKLLCDV